MEIFPAIDLIKGFCVRLRKGDFAAATVYDANPIQVAQRFAQAGADWLHVVDLDGAKEGGARQTEVIARLVQNATLKIQAGGGVRSAQDIERLLNAGVARVIVGSLAVQNPTLVQGWLKQFGGERLALAFDVKTEEEGDPQILTHGWQEASGHSLWDILCAYQDSGLETVLCTDVGRDGMMTGPNILLYRQLGVRFPRLAVLASGGVGSVADLRALVDTGVAGVIVGKALYEKRFDLTEAIAICNGDEHAG